MKNNLVKKIAVLAAVAVMGMSVAACGNKAEEATANEAEAPAAEDTGAEAPVEAEAPAEAEAPVEAEAPAAETLTEDEYVAKAQEASENLVAVMANVQTDLASIDPADTDAITEYIEGLKAPLAEFAALQAPEKFAEVQGKFKESCESLIEYFDLCIQMMDPEAEADAAELAAKTTEIMTAVQTNLTEAYAMMDELTSTEGDAETNAAPETDTEAEEETAE